MELNLGMFDITEAKEELDSSSKPITKSSRKSAKSTKGIANLSSDFCEEDSNDRFFVSSSIFEASTISCNATLSRKINEFDPDRILYWELTNRRVNGSLKIVMSSRFGKIDNSMKFSVLKRREQSTRIYKPGLSLMEDFGFKQGQKYNIDIRFVAGGEVWLIFNPIDQYAIDHFNLSTENVISVSMYSLKYSTSEEKVYKEYSGYKKYRLEADSFLNYHESFLPEGTTFPVWGSSIMIPGVKYHRDHIFSCKDGYLHYIPTVLISDISNIQMMTESENCSKGSKSFGTVEDFISRLISSGRYKESEIHEMIKSEKQKRLGQ